MKSASDSAKLENASQLIRAYFYPVTALDPGRVKYFSLQNLLTIKQRRMSDFKLETISNPTRIVCLNIRDNSAEVPSKVRCKSN